MRDACTVEDVPVAGGDGCLITICEREQHPAGVNALGAQRGVKRREPGRTRRLEQCLERQVPALEALIRGSPPRGFLT